MAAYYNEIDPFCVEWLRNLIAAGLIADGEVDDRDIRDIYPEDLRGYTQCHFFAGIGVWSYALKQSGWPDNKPIWSGSCPCQPFSASGKRAGFADERHLWPFWFWLIEQCCPDTIIGEQVASKDALKWVDLVSTDLEATGYTFGASDICAAGIIPEEEEDELGVELLQIILDDAGEDLAVMFWDWWMESKLGEGSNLGAPHIRQRIYWVANSERTRLAPQQLQLLGEESKESQSANSVGSRSATGSLADTQRAEQSRVVTEEGQSSRCGQFEWMGYTNNTRLEGRDISRNSSYQCSASSSGMARNFWGNSEWIWC